MATNFKWQMTAVGLLLGIAWSLLVLALTLALLVLGAIVLPAQAYETSTQGTPFACAKRMAPKNWLLLTVNDLANDGFLKRNLQTPLEET